MATRDAIKQALKIGSGDLSNPQARMDAALLSIMEKQDAGTQAVSRTVSTSK